MQTCTSGLVALWEETGTIALLGSNILCNSPLSIPLTVTKPEQQQFYLAILFRHASKCNSGISQDPFYHFFTEENKNIHMKSYITGRVAICVASIKQLQNDIHVNNRVKGAQNKMHTYR